MLHVRVHIESSWHVQSISHRQLARTRRNSPFGSYQFERNDGNEFSNRAAVAVRFKSRILIIDTSIYAIYTVSLTGIIICILPTYPVTIETLHNEQVLHET